MAYHFTFDEEPQVIFTKVTADPTQEKVADYRQTLRAFLEEHPDVRILMDFPVGPRRQASQL